nr:hypothetical protein [Clostridium paridis]
MVAWFDKEGVLHPVRFRFHNEDQSDMRVKVDRVITRNIEKLAGNKMIVYNCISEIEGISKQFQLKYELSTCKWILFKI